MSSPGTLARSPDSPGRRAWMAFRQHRPARLAAWFLGAAIVIALLGPMLSPYAPEAFAGGQFEAPSWRHWFGTDVHGRDVFTRVLYGGRLSLAVGLVGATLSLGIGVLWGAIAGYAGGRVDSVMMRAVDVLYAMPTLVFVIVVVTALNGLLAKWETAGAPVSPTFARVAGLLLGIGAVSWLTMARIVRGEVLSLRTRPFVEASRALGASDTHILVRHILPNLAGVVIVYLALTVPAVVLYESFLSYLGLGIQPPAASLGTLIAEGAAQINPLRIYWWLIVFPAGSLALALLALNVVGDGLRDALDPRAGR
ncbi:MAG: ABC transporter permease [Verrucomicrobia bacterium]|nr:ABC transporter permease [Verrucomicrobiota bacterium]